MPRATWLPEVLATAGCQVELVTGWQTRGSATFDPKGVVWHHTATGKNWTRKQLIDLIVKGTDRVPGPLSQLILERDGTFIVVASGRANHAGRGGWRGLAGNSSVLGIEAANDGRGELWNPIQLEAYRTGTAAILARIGRDEQWMCGHKEWAPTRKIDPHGLDMNRERAAVAALLNEEEDMSEVVKGIQRALGVTDDGVFGPVTEGALTAAMVAAQTLGPYNAKFLADMVDDLEAVQARPTSIKHILLWHRHSREAWPNPVKPGP